MAPLVNLLVWLLIFACAAWAAYYILDRSKMPTPAYWIVGGVFLVVLLLFLTGQVHPPTLYTPSSVR